MLTTFSVIIMLATAYAFFREGLFTSLTMFCNVVIASLVAVNFWEPLANLLEGLLAESFLSGYEDFLCLFLLFSLTLGGLRIVTNNLANTLIDYHQIAQQGGAALLGLLTGYLVAGFLICALQTLPWHENFMSFDGKYTGGDPMRQLMPPDRVWLAMMRRAGAYTLANEEDPQGQADPNLDSYYYEQYITFDKYGTFELRYLRYRRYGDKRGPLKYQGEFDREIHRFAPMLMP